MPDEKDTRNALSPLTQSEIRKAVKEALKDWLNDQFLAFGKRSFYGLMAAAFVGVLYLALAGGGWHKG